jgi:hypothetical protein
MIGRQSGFGRLLPSVSAPGYGSHEVAVIGIGKPTVEHATPKPAFGYM